MSNTCVGWVEVIDHRVHVLADRFEFSFTIHLADVGGVKRVELTAAKIIDKRNGCVDRNDRVFAQARREAMAIVTQVVKEWAEFHPDLPVLDQDRQVLFPPDAVDTSLSQRQARQAELLQIIQATAERVMRRRNPNQE
ncbi:MAG: hypothetical protein HY092_04080 [Candidatus Kerfeldbacteria bacterium]|nr:hypothetical protein [Candidatus Kerfeldbacteria bacterium]